MRCRWLILLFLSVATGPLRSQEPVNTGSLQDIYNHLSSVLAKSESIDFHGTHRYTDTEAASQYNYLPAGPVPFVMDVDIRFQGRGAKYHTVEKYEDDRNNPRNDENAWNGTYYQVFHRKDGYLLISKQNPDHNHPTIGNYNVLKMFDFLMPQSPAGFPVVSWELAKNLAAWRNCLTYRLRATAGTARAVAAYPRP